MEPDKDDPENELAKDSQPTFADRREADNRSLKMHLFEVEASPNNRKWLEELEAREAKAFGGRLGQIEEKASTIPANPDRKKAEQEWLEYCRTNGIAQPNLHPH